MKNKIALAVLLFSVLAGGSINLWAESTTNMDMSQTFEAIRQKHSLPALAAVVVKDGQICDRVAVGLRPN